MLVANGSQDGDGSLPETLRTMLNIKTFRSDFLKAWQDAPNEAMRGELLRMLDGPKHEIRAARLGHEPVLRAAMSDLEDKLNSILMGNISLPMGGGGGSHGRQTSGYATQAAVMIDMELARRAERKGIAYGELRGKGSHMSRWLEVEEKQHALYINDNGFTGYIEPPDPLTVACIVCRAAVGVACNIGKVA